MNTPREILLQRHKHAAEKLDIISENVVATAFPQAVQPSRRIPVVSTLWQELILPCRRIWVGLATAWLFIIAANFALNEPSQMAADSTTPPGADVLMVLEQQKQLMVQLLETAPPSPATRPKVPGPRGERRQAIVTG